MLFSTSLVALTLSPRVLRIHNTKRHSTICEMTFRTAILAVRLNRKRLVVVLESELYIYDISNMQILATVQTSPNPNGTHEVKSNGHELIAASNMCPFRVVRKQLPSLPSTDEAGEPRKFPDAITCPPYSRSHCAYNRRGLRIRCEQDGVGQHRHGA